MHLRPSWRTNNKKKLKGAYQGQIDVEVKSFAGFIAFHNLLIFFGKVETNKKKREKKQSKTIELNKVREKSSSKHFIYIFLLTKNVFAQNISLWRGGRGSP